MIRNYKTYNRNFTLLLYPDDKMQMKALGYIKDHYDYACILHDKDINEDGEIKKEHIHCIIRVGKNPRWVTAIAEELNIQENYIEGCNLEKQLRYLLHFDNPEKYQYKIEEVEGNMKNRLIESINKDKLTESEKMTKIIELLRTEKNIIDTTSLILWACENGYYNTIRRNQYIILKLIEENNRRNKNERIYNK